MAVQGAATNADETVVFDLAVVGGGPAGLATVLAARAQAQHWRVVWCRGPTRAFIPAYDGNSLVHRLNVPIERMGLDADAPVDFLSWLQREHPERDVQPGQFVPRRWFGEYLAHRACHADVVERIGEVRGLASVPSLDARNASGAGSAWRVCLDNGASVLASRIALAVGLPAGLPMPHAPPHWVADPWAWWRDTADESPSLSARDTVLLVGSGLTAVDMALGLRERGFGGRIRAVSPGGWPQPHAPASPLDAGTRAALDAALDAAVDTGGRARVVLHAIRSACSTQSWRAVIDALRASTNPRWSALPLKEQRRLLRHAFIVWNTHRHRMAPDVLAALHADAALTIEPGRVRVEADGRIVKRHRGAEETLDVALALDCRGPGFRAALAGDSLLARLVRDGLLDAHPLGTGVRAPSDPNLAVIGAARFGECFETTAVPELRQQAVEVVRAWLEVECATLR